jgi:Site-specific recombinase XerD
MNISAHIAFFKQEMQRRGLAKSTVNSYPSYVKTFFEQSKADHPKNIHEQEIRGFLGRFKESNTQRAYHSAIKKFYAICLNQENKFRYIPYCKQSKKLPIILSVGEVQQLFDSCENLKHKVILALLYSCSLRVSELINLKWSDIDRARMVINIHQAKGKKDRQVRLNNQLIQLLETYYRQYRSKEFVLNGQSSPQYTQSSVLQVIKQLAVKAVLSKRVYTHLVRHCSATHLLESGVDLNLIQRILGHSSVKTTAIYCHISHNLISSIQSPLSQIRL